MAVAFEFNGKSYLLPQGLLLGENLRGYATGGYPDTVRMIDGLEGVAQDWLGAALGLANMIEAVLTGAQVEPMHSPAEPPTRPLQACCPSFTARTLPTNLPEPAPC